MTLLRSGCHGARRLLYSRYDAVIGSTTADIAFQLLLDLRFRGRSLLAEQRDALQNHSRSAVAALHGITVDKRLLHRMQAFAVCQTFDRRNLLARHGADRCETGPMSHSLNQNRTRAALAFPTTVLCPRQVQIVTKHPEERALRICFDAPGRTVHYEIHVFILDPS